MSVEREILTLMFEGDLDLAKQFNQVGALHEARLHLDGASEKLKQIADLAVGHQPAAKTQPIIEA